VDLTEFKNLLNDFQPNRVAEDFLYKEFTHVIQDVGEYAKYINMIREDYADSEHISIAGSANWKYSTNPEKGLFREFSSKSDIDVVIVSKNYFEITWDELRSYHRNRYYSLTYENKQKLKRNGENVYSGFISPLWIPLRNIPLSLEFKKNTDKYSVKAVGFRTVNMLFFRNKDEAIDYYVRGFRAAKREIQ
jgi:hypothetical protein